MSNQMESLPTELLAMVCSCLASDAASLESLCSTSKSIRSACMLHLNESRALDIAFAELKLVAIRNATTDDQQDISDFMTDLLDHPIGATHVRSISVHKSSGDSSDQLDPVILDHATRVLEQLQSRLDVLLNLMLDVGFPGFVEIWRTKHSRRMISTWQQRGPSVSTMMNLIPLFPNLRRLEIHYTPARVNHLARILRHMNKYYEPDFSLMMSSTFGHHGAFSILADSPHAHRIQCLEIHFDERIAPHLMLLDDVLKHTSLKELHLHNLQAGEQDRHWLQPNSRVADHVYLHNTGASVELLETVFRNMADLKGLSYQLQDTVDDSEAFTYWTVATEVIRENFASSLESLSLTCVNPDSQDTLSMKPLPSLRSFPRITSFTTQAALLIHDQDHRLARSKSSLRFQAFCAMKDPTIAVTKLHRILPAKVERVIFDIGPYMELACKMFKGLDEAKVTQGRLHELRTFELSWHGDMELDRRIVKILAAANVAFSRC